MEYDNIRVPPHNIQSERSVIGGLLISPKRLDDVLMVIEAEDFYLREHRTIFAAICAISEQSGAIDVVTVSERLERDHTLDDAGGLPYIGAMAQDVPTAANILSYAKSVADCAKARRLITVGAEVSELGFAPGPIEERVDRAQAAAMALERTQDSGLVPMKACLKASIEGLEQRFEKGGAISGLSTGFRDLDAITTGLHGGDLILLAGRPSMGKTAMALDIARNVGLAGGAVAVFSMEMQAVQLADRQCSALGGVLFDNIRTGNLTHDEWTRLTPAVHKLAEAPISIDDTPALSVHQVRARARTMHRKAPLSLVVIDYLQLMRGSGENRNVEIGSISRGLKALAKELDTPIIALSQLNRSLEHRVDKRPIMSDLRESGELEQDADLVVFLYRDAVYNEESDKTEAEAIVAKQRNGPTGTVPLTFEGQYVRFRDHSPQTNWG